MICWNSTSVFFWLIPHIHEADCRKRAFCKQENGLFDDPQVVAWPRSRDFPSHWVFDKVVNKRSIPYPIISIFKRLIVSKTGVSTKSLISSGLLVNALLKQSSQHAHIMICQRSSELSEWKKQAGENLVGKSAFLDLFLGEIKDLSTRWFPTIATGQAMAEDKVPSCRKRFAFFNRRN